MAQFQIPQFIDTEPKIVGPLTLKQFAYIGIAGLLAFLLFFTLRLEIWIITAIILGVISASFAFLKFNGRPFEVLFLNFIWYIWKPRMYLWQRKEFQPTMPKIPNFSTPQTNTTSRIKSLWLNLLTKRSPSSTTPPPSTTTGQQNSIINK